MLMPRMLQLNLLSLMVLLAANFSYAGKLGVDFGYFDMQAKTKTKPAGSVSNLGAYRLLYAHPLLPQLDVNLAYSLIMSDIVGGDMGFGFDLGFGYYPFTASDAVTATGEATMRIEEIWRPYVAGSFHQRQFQSVQSSYSGFGIAIGTEQALNRHFSAKYEIRRIMLYGPSEATANETDLMVGIVFSH